MSFASNGMVVVDEGLIPTGRIEPADWSSGPELPTETVDHCFAGWNGTARIEDEIGSITLTARGAPHLHLYAPADGSALSLEPVSHRPDALNQFPEEMIALPPGCTASLTLWISASD